MELVLNQYDNYVSDDGAGVNFGDRKRHPNGPPSQVKVIDVMKDGNDDGTLMLPLSNLRYIRSIYGGIRNPDMQFHRYTTEYQSFHLYSVELDSTPEQIERGKAVGMNLETSDLPSKGEVQFGRSLHLVVVSVNGGGNHWMSIKYCDKANSILYTVDHLPNCVSHDILSSLFDVYHNSYSHARRNTAKEYRTAFVEGRLKKRKVRGQEAYNVEIERPVTIETKYLSVRIGGSSPFDE